MKKLVLLLFLPLSSYIFAQSPTLKTAWADQVNPQLPHSEYPRPQLVRENWQNLNGPWSYSILPKGSLPEMGFAGEILVPFPVESQLSGVQQTVGPEMELWYEKTLDLELKRGKNKVLLHFGAVDWEAEVWVNGQTVGIHQGGFDAFSFDITPYLKKGNEQTIRVRVWDPSDSGPQPRGKQVKEPQGIWYTPVTGIWQTVWLETVPQNYIATVYSQTDWESQTQVFHTHVDGEDENQEVEVQVFDQDILVGSVRGKANEGLKLLLQDPKPWSPDNPQLYAVKVLLYTGKKLLDQVESYMAYREVRMGKDENGFQRIFLNGEALFQYGPLDQGWWPDGLYTAPTEEALVYDIEKTKEMGFNMIRKHVKVEPARWYYHTDRLGMLVWQDMPSGDMGNRWEVRPGVKREGMYKDRSPESEAIFKREWSEIINEFKFFPSVVVWVPFNEAWGQFKTKEIVDLTRTLDDTRLINSASGGNFEMQGNDVVGDMLDLHNYPDPVMPDPAIFGENRILVLGEFGGLGLPLEGHTWQNRDNWGYQSFSDQKELMGRYSMLLDDLKRMIPKGLAAAIYTQTTDVEVEVNGLMTYDRKVLKFDPSKLKEIHSSLYQQE
ncbi:sugar-binding domain-containing protein [Algoriphagus sp.]|uniref:glycoside hydrolase family 2 protein n=1 Tax=Algoriphagus sp. TaxID=1872435 RepID=UPI00261E62A6|nr:sugar-binding domain-containing protein [Algoriphagus sp.]